MTNTATRLQPVSIVSLSPENLTDLGYDVRSIDQDVLEDLAVNLQTIWEELSLWRELDFLADEMNLPRI